MSLMDYCAHCIREIQDEGLTFKDRQPQRAVTLNNGTPVCGDHNQPTFFGTLTVGPADVLVVRCRHPLSQRTAERMRAQLKSMDLRAMVFDHNDIELDVIRKEDA